MSDKLEVISTEAGKAFDHAKIYYEAAGNATTEFLGYACLCGQAMLVLKEIADHGQFTAMKESLGTGKSMATLDNYMNFAKAIAFKNPTVGFLKDDSFLLSDKQLPKPVQDEVFKVINKSTKGKGMLGTIKEWRKKTAKKPEPMDAVKREEAHQQTVEESFTTAAAKLEWVLHWKEADYVLGSQAARAALAAICVRFGKHERAMKKLQRKPTKGTK